MAQTNAERQQAHRQRIAKREAEMQAEIDRLRLALARHNAPLPEDGGGKRT